MFPCTTWRLTFPFHTHVGAALQSARCCLCTHLLTGCHSFWFTCTIWFALHTCLCARTYYARAFPPHASLATLTPPPLHPPPLVRGRCYLWRFRLDALLNTGLAVGGSGWFASHTFTRHPQPSACCHATPDRVLYLPRAFQDQEHTYNHHTTFTISPFGGFTLCTLYIANTSLPFSHTATTTRYLLCPCAAYAHLPRTLPLLPAWRATTAVLFTVAFWRRYHLLSTLHTRTPAGGLPTRGGYAAYLRDVVRTLRALRDTYHHDRSALPTLLLRLPARAYTRSTAPAYAGFSADWTMRLRYNRTPHRTRHNIPATCA